MHERFVRMARAEGIATGRRLRGDTTVGRPMSTIRPIQVCSGDVLTRVMKKITVIAGDVGCETSRSQPERQTARARHCPSGARQGTAEPGAAETLLRQAACVRAGWSARRSGSPGRSPSGSNGQPASSSSSPWTAGVVKLEEMAPWVRQVMKQARAHLWRRHARRRQASQRVRAIDGDHARGQGR